MNKLNVWYKNKWFRRVLFVIAGASLGFAYYYFIGCTTGSCPLTSNPYTSVGYGGAAGLVLSFDGKSKAGESEPK